MNKKQNLLAIALSASFVLGGANVAQANEQDSQLVDTKNIQIEEASQQAQDIEAANNNKANENQEELSAETNKQSVEEDPLAENKEGLTKIAQNVSATNPIDPPETEPIGLPEGKNDNGQNTDQVSEGASIVNDNSRDESELGISKAKKPESQTATNEPNYGEDEGKIKDYSGSERYRETDLQPGDTNQESPVTDQGEVKDGLKFNIKNPSATSPSKTEYGYQITIDKKTGQRTYTKVYVTDSGLIPVDEGEKQMMDKGEKLTPESPDATYKPGENAIIDSAGRQRNYNYEASKETLEHINNKDNDFTSLGFKDNYTANNPRVKFFGGSFTLGYKVNPWPNENDKLEELKLNKNNYDPTKKFFVQGQDIDTGIKVDNIDENAKERLVGQVYNPITGDIVPGASAYIGEDGNIHIKMPEGALKKDENGKTVINEESIFNTPDYKALQNLDVKFFARPRTAEEFKTIAETPDEFGETGTYTGSGAGTDDINHKGTNVTIDKQGIDRYDHYNLIGDFKLNLDDTRYYDQSFLDGDNKDTRKNTSSAVKPGEPFEVKIYEPEDPGDTDKSADEMNAAEKEGEAAGKVILDFINRENQGKEDKDQWKVTLTDGDISRFTITPPKSAKAGDFIAVPVEYTYTNGSKDVHWFHFVVQESDNYRPEYHAEIGFRGDTLTSRPDPLPSKDETKKNLPLSYELVPGTYKDSAGNVWDNITVDKDTGVVTATVPEHADIKGGENLFVDIKVNYIDEYDIEKEETVKAQFIACPKYKEEVTKEFTSEIPFETKVVYDDTLEAGKVVKTEGVVGESKTSFSQVVINGEKGIINEAGEFVKGEEKVLVETIKEKQDAEIRIGTKPAETTVEIPFDTEYELDYTKKKGEEPTEITPGVKGEVTIKTTRDPETGEITVTKEETKAPTKRKLSIPAGTEGTHEYKEEKPFTYEVEFDPNFYTNYPDATDNYKIVTEGKVGEKTTKWKIENSQIVGEPEVTETDPTNAVIKVGQKDYTGNFTHEVKEEIPYTVRIIEDATLEAGKSEVVTQGQPGEKTTKFTQAIKNGQADGDLKSETRITKKPVEHVIRVGKKPTTNSVNVNKDVGVTIKYTYDPTLDVREARDGKFTPGTVKTVVTNKYNPETGEIESSEETVITPAVQEIIIGTNKYTGTFENEISEVIPFETKVVFDKDLEPGIIKVDEPGVLGEQRKKFIQHFDNGVQTSTEEQDLGKTEPKDRVVRVGYKTEGSVTYGEEIPFGYKVEYDPEMEAGKYEVVTPGEPGTKLTIWTIKNSEIDGSPTVLKTDPVDAVIKVGNKDFTGEVKHKEHFEIPFEVEVRHNDQLPAGTSKEIQKGEKGSYDVEYKQAIKNGQADGEMTKTESNRKDSVKHIIEIGTKVETPENNYSKDVEVEIEYVYDDTKDKGLVETGDLTPGKVETKVVDKYNPETGKVEQTTEEVVTKAKQKVIVGTKDFTGVYEYKKTCPIPFEVEIVEDPTLSKGEKVVDQEGKAGSKTTSYEQDIKNGKAEGEVRQTGEEVTEKPTKHIVRVGTKPLEGNRENVVDKAIPYETKVIYDDTLDAGTRVVDNEGKDGKERVTTTITSKDGNIEYNSEGKVIEEKQDRVVRVGTKPIVKEIEKPFETEYIYDENVEMGKEEEVRPGQNGKVTITTSYDKEQGKLVTKEETKDPVKRVVRVGIKPVVKTEEIPHDTEYKHNTELKAGETKLIQAGTPGKVTITTTFNKETGKLETKVERTEPTNAIYEYGSKTEGTLKVRSDIPYEVEIIEDNTMDAGTHEVVQKGKVGVKETTIIIENSLEKSRNDETITEAVKKIIKVGTKPNDKMCPIPEEPEFPDQPETPENSGEEDPKDPEKPGEEDPKDSESPGEEDSKDPETPGEEDPKDPEIPGEEDPKDPEKPGEDDPKDPENPETPEEPETPENPEEPGKDKPNEPETPGETPEESEKPVDPEKPSEPEVPEKSEKPEKPDDSNSPIERPEMPEGPNEENPKTEEISKESPEEDETINNEDNKSESNEKSTKIKEKSTNPKTGIDSMLPIFTSMGLSITGLVALKKKKEDEE